MARLMSCLLAVLITAGFKVPWENQKLQSEGLLGQVVEGRQRLTGESVKLLKGVVGTRRVRVGRRRFVDVPVIGIVGREMALAIGDGQQIRIARAIKRDSGLEVTTPGFSVSMRRENGINSNMACIVPDKGTVLAVKYPVDNENNRFGGNVPVIEAVYTPYSPELSTEEVVEHGLRVTNDFINRAYVRLAERGVMSRAFLGRKIIDVVPKDVLRALLMNEHIDPAEFKTSGLTGTLCERVLTVIATNGGKAYGYSISSAGARGLVQMIPSTYRLIQSRYPAAGLNPDFAAGMADPVNAIAAQIVLCDSDWEAIQSRSPIGVEKIGPYLAAAYNGGVGRVLSVLAYNETDWMEEPDSSRAPTKTVTERVRVRVRTRRGRTQAKYVLKRYTVPIFRSQTSKYVNQYHWINDFLLARSTREPRSKDARTP